MIPKKFLHSVFVLKQYVVITGSFFSSNFSDALYSSDHCGIFPDITFLHSEILNRLSYGDSATSDMMN